MMSELGVIIKAKDLSEYIFTVTDKSPKKFRMTLTARIQNLSLDVIDNLLRANSIKVKENRDSLRRVNHQREAKASLDVLCSVAEIARRQQCIQPKHYDNICMMAAEVHKMLYGWVKSDMKRQKNRNIR